jgi:hypothetical protein
MRGKKPYNIRNIEAHLNTYIKPEQTIRPFSINRNMLTIVQQNNQNNLNEQQKQNEYINSKYGVSRYAANLVSGRMFKKIF